MKRGVVLTLEKPSIRMTAISKTEENIPSIDATESHESGKNTAGISLQYMSAQYHYENRALYEHNQAKDLVDV